MKISCQSCGAKYNIADEKVRGKIVKIACKKCGARIEIDGREQADQSHGDQDETRVYDHAAPPGAPAAAGMWTVSVDDNDQREVNTDQLIELFRAGTINADTFVWRDGMADWQTIRDVEALRDPISRASGGGATSVPPMDVTSEPSAPAAAMPSAPPPNGNGAAAPLVASGGGYAPPQTETAQAGARLGGSRRAAAVDLFAPNAGGGEDEDVATSAPTGAALTAPLGGGAGGAAVQESGKPLGARNENSVLFSLAALTASGPTNAPAAVAGDDEKSGLIDIQKLAASAKSTGGENRAKLDDIMNLGGGGAFGALGAPILAPPPPAALELPADEKKSKTNPILFALIGLVLVLGIVVVVLVMKSGKSDDTAAATKKDDKKGLDTPSTQDTPGTTKAMDTTATTNTVATPTPDTTSTPTPTDSATGASTGTKPPPTATTKGTTVAAGTTTTATTKPTTTDTGTKPTSSPGTKCTSLDCQMGLNNNAPPKPTTDTSSGPAFDKDAARASLSAIGYKDCPGSGSGSVVVTFAPSGGVAGASVSGDLAGNSCIAGRFMHAHVPAFSGPPKSVGWKVSL